jgi:hypothetical protein
MHVGVAKTGTTYLQRILFSHRDALREAGLLYPGAQAGDQFVASIDLRGLDDPKFDHFNAGGAWDRIADEVREYDGNAVISHETFARASSQQIERVVDSFDTADLRIVLTVRDLGRQIPAVWQETLKNRATGSYHQFLHDIFENPDVGPHKFFWKPQDIARLVRRWIRQVGSDRVVLVTVPPSGAPRDELWNRFARAIDLPDVPIELPTTPANSSLGPAESELLRHLNASLPADFPWPRYIKTVKRQFAEGRLASRDGGRIVVPPEWHGAVKQRATEMVSYLEQSGVTVIGDLNDLTPVLPVVDVSGPDDLSRDDLMRVSAEVLRDYLLAPPRRPAPPPAAPPPAPPPAPRGPRPWARRMRERIRRRLRGAG